MWIESVVRGSRVQLYEYFKPGLTQIVLATGKPTCPRLVPFTSLSPYPFSNPPYFPYALVFLSPFPPHPSLCYRRACVFPRPRRRFSLFSHLSRRSTPLSLSSPVVNAVSVFRVAYIHIYLLQLLSYPSFPLCSVALERQPRSIRFQETWKNEFGERDSSISVSTRGAPWASVNEWDIVNGIDDQNGTIIAVAIIRPRSSINNTPSPPLYNHESWYL